jgi:histidinol-phosphate aminotransferase
MARYPDGAGFALKAVLAAKHGVPADSLVLGNGSNDVLDMAARAFLAPGSSAVYAEHAFAVYPIATLAVGATGIEVPARAYGHDLDAMLAALRPDTRMVWIANPNNPTGTFNAGEAVRAFLARVPGEVLVVLDEAYHEYLPPAAHYDSVRWIDEFPNLVVTRTFSKAYGLAGLRVGYALADPAVADLLNRVRQPFNVSQVAQEAAVGALADAEFLAQSRETNFAGMAQLEQGFRARGLDFIPSRGNFVSVRVGAAGKVFQSLLRQGVIVRPVGNYGMPEFLRVSVGLEQENRRFLAALEIALEEQT